MAPRLVAANNMPVQAPAYPSPFVPYEARDQRMVYAVCRGDEAAIRALLEPTPFDWTGDDRFVVSVVDFTTNAKCPFFDAAIVVPVTFRGQPGGHYIFEYEDNDAAIAAGRELWGYPKKYARCGIDRLTDGTVVGWAERHGRRNIEIRVWPDDTTPVPVRPVTLPHLNVRTIPAPDGPGVSLRQVIGRDTSPDLVMKSELAGRAEVTLRPVPRCPLDLLAPREVLGGVHAVADFFATEENGWGWVVADLGP